MSELDLKDRKILYELDIDARQSLSKIAKKAGLSKEVVNYRINKLQEDGVINGFYARIDSSKAGLTLFRTFLKLQNITPEKEKELIDYLVSQKEIGWCVSIQGNWDINFIFWANNNDHFFKFWKKFKGLYGEFLGDNQIAIFAWFTNLPKGFLIGKKPEGFTVYKLGLHEKVDLDELDFKILRLLSKKAREPLIEIAKQLEVSDKVISYRIKRLEKEKVIVSYGVQIDLEKIGQEYWKIQLSIKNYPEKRLNELNNFCIEHPNIIYTNELIGGADFEIEGVFKNYSKLQEFIKETRTKFNDIIKDFEVMLYYNEYKLNLFP